VPSIKSKAIKDFFLIFFLIFSHPVYTNCNFNTSDYITELQNPKNITKIDITIPDSKKWNKNLLKITLDRSSNINPKHRDMFNSNLKVFYKFGSCFYNARVRISGDWKDHIEFNNGSFKASLDVKLSEGNILNAVRFKLLIPKTRNSINEVIGSLVMREFQIISPETFMTNVSVNNSSSTYIFQENSAKEMLERNLKREGPIFEGNEDLLWSYKNFEIMQLEDVSLSRLVNDSWAKKGLTSSLISLNSFIELQKIYLQYQNHEKRSSNQFLDKKFKDYAVILLAMNGSHALYPHNRKFYFNAIDQSFEPIYYDGDLRLDLKLSPNSLREDVDLQSFLNSLVLNDINRFREILSSNEVISRLEKEFKSRVPDNISNSSILNEAILNILNNLKIIEEEYELKNQKNDLIVNEDLFYKNFEGYIERLKTYEISDFEIITHIDLVNEVFYLYSGKGSALELSNISFQDLSKIMADNQYKGRRYEIVLHPEKALKSSFKEINFFDGKVFMSEKLLIEINQEAKKIEIKQSSADNWILFKNVNLRDWHISFLGLSNDDTKQSKQRFNDMGLTGCLNFYETTFYNTDIVVKGGQCEDSLNIISSEGKIRLIDIKNAYADAIDMDFSKVEVSELTIEKAGNDCFDVSGGKYMIENAFLSFCGDKGISVGELSELTLNNGKITDANIGLSTKDFSISEIERISLKNVNICIEAIQKKQEFGGGKAIIANLEDCNSKLINDKDSSIIYGNSYEL
tara:strand:+ start:4074 stop:6305 length:2232 start_codon:yes stop_codon:yes gene_type:complete